MNKEEISKDGKKACNLIIIGNGFDLLLGLPTRFSNFIEFCRLYDQFVEYIDTVKSEVATYDFNSKLDEDGVLRITEDLLHTFPCIYEEEEKQILRELKQRINDSKLIKFCIELNKDKNYKWKDFEKYLLFLCESFEEYVKEMDFTVRFCHKQDPESKALVENVVWKVKHMFLVGRTYTGIDSLNGAALEWLDRFASRDYNSVTKKIPKEMFKGKYRNLVRVRVVKRDNTCILTVRKMNQIHYKGNNYEVISGVNIESMRVKVVEKDVFINIYKPVVNELKCTHEIPIGQGRVLSAKKGHTDLEVYKLEVSRFLGKSDIVDIYFEKAIRQQKPMYHL